MLNSRKAGKFKSVRSDSVCGTATGLAGAPLFGHGFASGFPSAETAIEVINVGEAFGFELLEGFGAAATGGAVDKVGLVLVELGDLFTESFVEEINVHGFGDVAVFEFIVGADVEDDDGFVRLDEFGGGGGIHMLGLGGGGLGGLGGIEGQTEGKGGDEEAEGEQNGFHGVSDDDG